MDDKSHMRSKEPGNNIYPNYLTDLLNQNSKPYEELERELGRAVRMR